VFFFWSASFALLSGLWSHDTHTTKHSNMRWVALFCNGHQASSSRHEPRREGCATLNRKTAYPLLPKFQKHMLTYAVMMHTTLHRVICSDHLEYYQDDKSCLYLLKNFDTIDLPKQCFPCKTSKCVHSIFEKSPAALEVQKGSTKCYTKKHARYAPKPLK
jgi:hypothetical protein